MIQVRCFYSAAAAAKIVIIITSTNIRRYSLLRFSPSQGGGIDIAIVRYTKDEKEKKFQTVVTIIITFNEAITLLTITVANFVQQKFTTFSRRMGFQHPRRVNRSLQKFRNRNRIPFLEQLFTAGESLLPYQSRASIVIVYCGHRRFHSGLIKK